MAGQAVHVWRGSIQIPTYAEDAPNPNPPFDLFSFGRFNYPYPMRDGLTNRRELVSWRSLHLENEYLRLTVLPDLGGHLYSCLDKRTGREMFYANTAIKKALIGYRGAWAAFGIEFNFPVSHNWVSMSPVDFATETECRRQRIDLGRQQGSGLRLAVACRTAPPARRGPPSKQRVELYNSSDVRHRYYWWTNAAVQVWEDSRLVYPTELMATHGFTSDRAVADRSPGARPQRHPQPDRRSGVALHLQDARRIRRRLPSAHQQRHGARRRSGGAAGPQGLVVGQRPRSGHVAHGVVGRRQRVRGAAGRPVPQSGDVRLPRAAGDGAVLRALVAGARSRRDHPRERRCGAAHGAPRGARAWHSRSTSPATSRARGISRASTGTRTLLDRTASLSPREVWRATLERASPTRPSRSSSRTATGRPVLTHTENSFDPHPPRSSDLARRECLAVAVRGDVGRRCCRRWAGG